MPGERSERFDAARSAIDAANAEDPNTIDGPDGPGPKELVHSLLVTEWLLRLAPDADELQLLAALAHHLRRWTSPRDAYPTGRAGYLRWRRDAGRRQAEEVVRLLLHAGYSADEAERVAAIVRKDDRATDPAVQANEDARCLVFLELQLVPVAEQLGEPATVEVLVRTLRKMSPAAIELAATLPLDPQARALLAAAVGATADAPGD